MKALQTKEAKFRADTEIVIVRHVAIGILPCDKTTSLRLDANLATSAIFDTLRQIEPSKKSKKGGAKGSVALSKESIQLGCVPQDSHQRNLFHVKKKIAIKTRRQILQGHLAPKKNRERKGPSQGVIQKCEPHERSPCAPKFGKDHMRRPCTKNDTPAE